MHLEVVQTHGSCARQFVESYRKDRHCHTVLHVTQTRILCMFPTFFEVGQMGGSCTIVLWRKGLSCNALLQEPSRHRTVPEIKHADCCCVTQYYKILTHFGISIFPSKFIESIFLTRSLIVPLQFKENPFSHGQMYAVDLKDFVFGVVLTCICGDMDRLHWRRKVWEV